MSLLLFCCTCDGEDGVDDVADDGLLLESTGVKTASGSLLVAFGNVLNCNGISAVWSI